VPDGRRERREAALQRHWRSEAQAFGLKPWECPPCMADGDVADGTAWAASIPRARELRARILAADPHHYDDLKGD
jgi:hypothetical protein